jgi:autotransporter-associated beta strand protein
MKPFQTFMKAKTLLPLISAATLIGGANLASAGTHTWQGGKNSLWSDTANWKENTVPAAGENPLYIIIPPSPFRLTSSNDIPNLTVDYIYFQGNSETVLGEQPISLRPALQSVLSNGTNNTVTAPLILNASQAIIVGTYDDLTLSGQLSGPGGFTKYGRGKLMLTGSDNNTYAGVTTVAGGWLDLAKPAFTTAIPKDFIIGLTDQNPYFVWASIENNHQIDDSADVTVNPNCYLDLKGHMEVIHSLQLVQAAVTTDIASPYTPGQLTIFGGVTVTNSMFQQASISGHLSLAGAIRTFALSDYSVLGITAVVTDGGQTAGILKTGNGTLVLSGANDYTGNTTVSAGIVEVDHASGLGAPNGNAYVQIGASLALGPVTVTGKHLFLNGAGAPAIFSQTPQGAVFLAKNNATWAGPVTLQGDTTICVATNVTLTVNGAIDGNGNFSNTDWGTLALAGSTPNTYQGTTFAQGGKLLLAKSTGVNAVPGPLVMGVANPVANTNWVTTSNMVQLAASQQIPDTAAILINVTGLFDLNGFTETIGPLTMFGGDIEGNGGLLILNGDVVGSTLWNNWSYINCKVSLGGSTRTFTSLTPGAIFMEGPISDGLRPAGIIKMGPYGLRLDATNNTFSGLLQVNEGWLSAEQPGSLGSPVAGTVVAGGAELSIGLNFHGPVENLTLNDGARLYSVGNNSWDGNIVVNGAALFDVDTAANNEVLEVNGVISGPGSVNMVYGGTLRFGGNLPNTYAGPTSVQGSTLWSTVSTLELNKPAGVTAVPGSLIIGNATNPANHEIVRLLAPNQITDSARVTIDNSGLFDVNNQYDTIGSLAGSGNVNLILGALTAGGDNTDTTFSGVIAGVGFVPLTKEGTGRMTLTGTNTCSGKMVVNHGHLYVNGAQSCGVEVSPAGSLHGRGVVGAITGKGGWVIPGDNLLAPTHGQMQSATLALDPSSSFNVDLGGTAASGNYDRLSVAGSVVLSNATFHLTQSAPAHSNDVFTIIKNGGGSSVKGIFAGFPEGTVFNLGANLKFKITYQGGAYSNDVVLTQLSESPALKIDSISKLGNGQMQLLGTGSSGVGYIVLANTDLGTTNWVNIGTANADPNGAITFVDPNAPNFQQRFYRLMAP